jgi:peptidoglycan/xylan/chitin deacetylase (PgdA/CDA1 family)
LIEHVLKNKLSKEKEKELLMFFELKKITKKKLITILKSLTIKDSNKLNRLAEIFQFTFSDYLKKERPYLIVDQILELKNRGLSFGSHSKNHPYYAEISLEEQLKETIESVNEVHKLINLKRRLFSFPFSDDGVRKEFFNQMKKEGIITFGSAGIRKCHDLMHFQRIPMEYNTIYAAETIIKGELVYYILKKVIGK